MFDDDSPCIGGHADLSCGKSASETGVWTDASAGAVAFTSSVSPRRIYLAAALVAVAIAGALITASQLGGDEESAGGGAPVVVQGSGLLDGIPQEGVFLGDPSAPVLLVEFADLQCPFCAQFSVDAFPAVVEEYVRPGRVRIAFRGLAFIGPDSEKALRAALAAGEQGKLWTLVELLYQTQGPENTGWVTDDLLRELGGAIEGLDVDRMMEDRSSDAVEREMALAERAAVQAQVTGTPTFLAGPSDTQLRPLAVGALDAAAFRSALDALVGP